MAKLTPDQQQRIACLTALAIAFNREVSEEFFMAYLDMGLTDVPTADLKTAVAKAVRVCKFMPTVAELRDLCGNAVETDKDAAAKGWESLNRAVRRVGYYRSPNFIDPLVTATVRAMGGWLRIVNCFDCEDGEKASDWETWTHKRFVEDYTRLARRGVSADQTAPLLGSHDAQNIASGRFEAASPHVLPQALPAPQTQRIGVA